MESAKKFKAAINRTFSKRGGVFWQSIKDNQLTSYLMEMSRDFCQNVDKVVVGSLVIGRQPNFKKVNVNGEFVEDDDINGLEEKVEDFDNSVYILNEELQV